MGYGIKVRVFGEYACFTNPLMKSERVSYDIMTPSAARGIIESVYFKPAIKWTIDKIHVINEIKFTSIRRNEISEKILLSKVKLAMVGKDNIERAATQIRQQRAMLALKNVQYVIEAHFDLTDKAGESDDVEKHYNIVLRRLRKGQCFKTPCFGVREFAANFEIIEDRDEIPKSKLTGNKDLGYMLYDMDYEMIKNKGKKDSKYSLKTTPMFFRAEITDGILDLRNVDILK